MAGSSMTFDYDDGYDRSGRAGTIRKVIVDWLSDDATGAVSGTSDKIVGELLKGVTDPDGDAAPSDNYDITLSDAEGANLLANCMDDLADRDTANAETVDFIVSDGTGGTGARPVVSSPITVAVANAGNAKAGRLVLYYRP